MQDTHLCDAATGSRFRILARWPRSAWEELAQVENLATGRRMFLRAMRASGEVNPGDASELHREARAIASLEPNCVLSVLGAGTLTDGRAYYVTEAPQGFDGFRELKSRLSIRERREVALQCLRFLAVAEARRVVLPSLSEGNFQITREGDSIQLKMWPEPARDRSGLWLHAGEPDLLELRTREVLSSLARLLVTWFDQDFRSDAEWLHWVGRAQEEDGKGFRSVEHARLAFLELDFERPQEWTGRKGDVPASHSARDLGGATLERGEVPWMRILLGFALSFLGAAAVFRWLLS